MNHWYYDSTEALAREAEKLTPTAPELIEFAFRRAFGDNGRQDDRSPLQGGILPIMLSASSRRENTRYLLIQAFPEFLEREPVRAATVLGKFFSDTLLRDHSDIPTLAFSFLDQPSRIFNLDEDTANDIPNPLWNGDAEALLGVLNNFLLRASQLSDQDVTLTQFLKALARSNRSPFLWEHLLDFAAAHVQELGRHFLPLLTADPILAGRNTADPANRLLKALFATLSPSDRKQIEVAILTLTTKDKPDLEFRHAARQVFLLTLPEQSIISKDVRYIRQQVSSRTTANLNWPTPDDGSQLLKHSPIDELCAAAYALIGHTHQIEDANVQGEAAWDLLAKLAETFLDRSTEPKEQLKAQGAYAALAGILARTAPPDSKSIKFPTMAIRLCHIAEQPRQPKGTKSLDPRPKAVEALITLLCSAPSWNIDFGFTPSSLLLALATDMDDRVRYAVFDQLNLLQHTLPEIARQILDHVAPIEMDPHCLLALASEVERRERAKSEDALKVLVILLRAIELDTRPNRHLDRALNILLATALRTYLNTGSELARSCLRVSSDRSSRAMEASQQATREIRAELERILTLMTLDSVSKRAIDVAAEWIQSDCDTLTIAMRRPSETMAGDTEMSVPTVKQAQAAYLRLDGLVRTIQLASSASPPPSPVAARMFLETVDSLLDEAIALGIPRLTHHAIETYATLESGCPREVFIKVATAVEMASADYAADSLAAKLVIPLIQRFISNQTAMLQQDKALCRALVRVLDAFVAAGWPSARDLANNLDAIYR